MHNFILDTDQKVKEKLELLDSIKDIQIAHRLSDVIFDSFRLFSLILLAIYSWKHC